MKNDPLMNRFHIDPQYLAKASSLYEVWLDYGIPTRWMRAAWADDIDDAGRKKLEQLLIADGPTHHNPRYQPERVSGTIRWKKVAKEYRAKREALPE